jgi:hypothetical protein
MASLRVSCLLVRVVLVEGEAVDLDVQQGLVGYPVIYEEVDRCPMLYIGTLSGSGLSPLPRAD